MAEATKSQKTLRDVWLELHRIGNAVDTLEAILRAPQTIEANEALSAKETAKLLGISPRTLRRHASLGHIRPIRIGRRITYTRQAVDAFQRDAAKGNIKAPASGRLSK